MNSIQSNSDSKQINKRKNNEILKVLKDFLTKLMLEEVKDIQSFIYKISSAAANLIATGILCASGQAKPYVWTTRIAPPIAKIILPTISRYAKEKENDTEKYEWAKAFLSGISAISSALQEHLSAKEEPISEQYWGDDNAFFTVGVVSQSIETFMTIYYAVVQKTK